MVHYARTKPSISVLMPAHNSERTIDSSVKSALWTMPSDGELVIFLDGCSDKTSEIVSGFSDSRIRILESKEKVGVVRARQILLDAARADLVANLDSDDLSLPGRFRRQIRVLKEHDADIVFGNAILFGPEVNKFGFRPEWPIALNPRQARISLNFTNPFVNSSMLAKKTSLVALGGYQSKIEDLGMWLQAAKLDLKIIRTAGYVVCYRVHSGQLSRNKNWQFNLANDPALAALRRDYTNEIRKTLVKPQSEDLNFEIWKEYVLSSWGLILQNIGLIDYLKFRFSHKLRDSNKNYRHTTRTKE